jgi:hypothetical protein
MLCRNGSRSRVRTSGLAKARQIRPERAKDEHLPYVARTLCNQAGEGRDGEIEKVLKTSKDIIEYEYNYPLIV